MPQAQAPSPPNTSQTYGQGIQTFLKYLPQMLQTELKDRGQYDPQFIQQQQGLQGKYGPQQYQNQLSALNQFDPNFQSVYGKLGQSVLGGLSPNNPYVNQANTAANQAYGMLQGGTQGDPQFQQQTTAQIRAAQAARGNVYGAAPVSGEALYEGQAGQNLYTSRLQNAEQAGQTAAQQRQLPISNAGLFLGGNSPLQAGNQVQPVQAPNQFQIVNPNSGYLGQQIGQQNYQNQLAAYSNQSASNQGWGSLAGGIVGGVAGGYLSGGNPAGVGLGASAGGAAGGTIGGYFSDRRIKEDIKEVGKTKHGIPIVEFNFVPWFRSHMGWKDNQRFRGVIAQDVQKIMPDAVVNMHGTLVGVTGSLLGVLYHKIGVKFEEI